MTQSEKVTGIAAKIYEARTAVRRLTFEPMYSDTIRDYQESIKLAMTRNRCGALYGAMACIRALQEKMPDSGVAQMWILAAVAEMIEPS